MAEIAEPNPANKPIAILSLEGLEPSCALWLCHSLSKNKSIYELQIQNFPTFVF